MTARHSQFDRLKPEGFLSRFKSGLNADKREEAEEWADAEIHSAFFQWDRSTWQNETLPSEIKTVWTSLGAGRYWQLEQAALPAGRSEREGKSRGDLLIKEARDKIKEIQERGGPLDEHGHVVQRPADDSTTGPMFLDIHA